MCKKEEILPFGLNISEYPKELKLKLLSFAPNLRRASREWYSLHNELFKIRCYLVNRKPWTNRELEELALYVKEQFDELKPLLQIFSNSPFSHNTISSENSNFLSVSWFWVYCAAFIFPLVELNPITLRSKEVRLAPRNGDDHKLKLWLEIIDPVPELMVKLRVFATFISADAELAQQVIEPLFADFHPWITKKGYYCLNINKLEFIQRLDTLGELVRFSVEITGTGIDSVKLHSIDFAPYQDNNQWFLFYTSEDGYKKMKSRRLWQRDMQAGSACDSDIPVREFVFRYLNASISNPQICWTNPYLMKDN